jgi:hypothetical protein
MVGDVSQLIYRIGVKIGTRILDKESPQRVYFFSLTIEITIAFLHRMRRTIAEYTPFNRHFIILITDRSLILVCPYKNYKLSFQFF